MKSMFRLAAVALASLFVCLLLTTGSASADAAGDALLAKHRAFVGWQEGDGTFTSWRIVREGQRKNGEQTSTVTIAEVRRSAVYRETVTASGSRLTTDSGFTGRVFWDGDYNGNVVTLFDDDARLALDEDAVFDEATTAFPGTLRGSAKIGDVSVSIVRVQPGGGFPIDLYVDASGAYHRAVINPGKDGAETLNIDGYYSAPGGKKVVGTIRYESGTSYNVTSFQPNAPVSDAELHPPQPRQHWDFNSQEAVPLTVAVRDGGGREVQIRASIDGHEGTFLIDTGASGTVLYRPFINDLNLEKAGDSSYTGVNGKTVKSTLARVKTLQIGKNVLHDTIVELSDQSFGSNVDGILGYNVYANALVDVDLNGRTLTISDPAKFGPAIAKGAYAFDVNLSSRQPGIRASVSGVEFKPVFDTGDDFLVIASEGLRSGGRLVTLPDEMNLGQSGVKIENRITFSGVDGSGETSAPCSRVNQMAIGPYRYESALVCFGRTNAFGVDGGLIGFDFLRHFNWTLDYPDGKFVLMPNGA